MTGHKISTQEVHHVVFFVNYNKTHNSGLKDEIKYDLHKI